MVQLPAAILPPAPAVVLPPPPPTPLPLPEPPTPAALPPPEPSLVLPSIFELQETATQIADTAVKETRTGIDFIGSPLLSYERARRDITRRPKQAPCRRAPETGVRGG